MRLLQRSAWSTENIFQRAKRASDIALTSVGLLVVSPLVVGTAIAIKLTSPGPVFFRQERVGHNGKRFSMLKFRSMYVNAEARRDELLASSDRTGICFKQKDDPRITRVGRFMRRYSLDEIPQLLNVLFGDMSLVGPRPALPEEVAAYSPYAMKRLNAVPGITGIWQVSGRADIDFDRMIEMDIAYSRSNNIFLDFLLLALTARAVISGRGAY
jgi:lipopolysaccharide/colanic/teichoic acid biosynthesis glycosyltransferase